MKISCVTNPTLNLPTGHNVGRRELSDRIVAENCRTDGQALTLARRLGRLLPLLSLRAAAAVAAGTFANVCTFLAGSFSDVSKRNFARKYAFDSIFQALQDLHTFAPLQSQNFRKKSI